MPLGNRPPRVISPETPFKIGGIDEVGDGGK